MSSIDYKLKGVSETDELALKGTSGQRGWGNDVNVGESQKGLLASAFKKIRPLLAEEKLSIVIAFIAILINSSLLLLGPLVVGYTIDRYVVTKDFYGVFIFSGILLLIYIFAFFANFVQMRVMGGVGQRTLFRLRNLVFNKLQELPLAFFNQNRAGDLISRLNNDTNKLNQFFSQTLMQFAGNFFVIIGAGIFVVAINWRLGLATLVPALGLLIFSRAISAWVKRVNLESLRAEGAMSGEIQESLSNFRVILAFNRRDYFRKRFSEANYINFKTSVLAGLGNNVFSPVYDFAGNLAQLAVLAYGIFLITHGELAVGLLVSFLLYVSRFYDPLRQLAQLWSALQVAMAAWDRLSEVLEKENNLKVLPVGASGVSGASESAVSGSVSTKSVSAKSVSAKLKSVASSMVSSTPPPVPLIEFRDVCFSYPDGKQVLHYINFKMEKGKTYALVGPTGGGKTTTASVIARLYDPTEGNVFFNGRDIRSYTPEERTAKISFILQEPFLFSGTVRDNILYGNPGYALKTGSVLTNSDQKKHIDMQLMKTLESAGLEKLIARFEKGLDTEVSGSGETISLGQRQLIAFIRAVLRQPDILILDEATANIDTVTEQLLEEILRKLPTQTTRVIIAHRLNTIENADEIFFVNAGEIIPAGSFQHAVDMLLHDKRES
jgi:ATP-binding cassette subfamily B protein